MSSPRRSLARLLATVVPLVGAVLVVEGLGAQTTGSTTGQVFAREGELLTAVRSEEESYDELVFDIGRKGVRASRPGVIPEGWSCAADGAAWRCRGPALGLSYFSFRPTDGWRLPERLELGVYSGGRRLFEQRLPVQPLPPSEVRTELDDLLEVPARVTPGSYLVATPKRPEYRTPGWRLQVGGSPAARASREELERLPEPQRDLADYLHLVPGTVGEGSELRFTYDDPWGERLVDAPYAGYRLTEPLPEPCRPEVFTCQERVALGGSICVCGCFPAASSWADLTLDGRPVPAPSAASPFVVRFPLPGDLEPGVHTIAWSPSSGGQGGASFEAVRVGGSIDQAKLRVGQSTWLHFEIEGTPERMEMQIEKTAGRIRVQGGNEQTAYTSGGSPNTVRRALLALGVGDFGIEFGIDLPPCPCEALDEAVLDERTLHPISLSGRAGLVAPTLDLEVPIAFSADNVISRTPRPPIEREGLEVELAQLGLTARADGFGEFVFETRAGEPSIGRFSKVRLDPRGYFFGGNVDLDLRTEFSVGYDRSLPIEPGGRYEMRLTDWSFQGLSEDLGEVELTARPGEPSGVVFRDIEIDAGGTRLFGYADFDLKGRIEVDSPEDR